MSTPQAKFMGRIAASLSHDLCNVLATIQQTSGLLDDYLALARKEQVKSLGLRPQFKYNDKFTEIIAQIKTQVDRGQDLCESLSRLAHSPDENPAPVDLGGACALMAGLCSRQAKRAKSSLEVVGTPERVTAQASLIDVLALMGDALTRVFELCQEQGPVRLHTGIVDGCAFVDVSCGALAPEAAGALAGELCKDLLCSLGVEAVEGGVRLRFKPAQA